MDVLTDGPGYVSYYLRVTKANNNRLLGDQVWATIQWRLPLDDSNDSSDDPSFEHRASQRQLDARGANQIHPAAHLIRFG